VGGLLSSVIVGIKMSVIEMGSHKMRSALSVIGVLLGVAALVAMLTLIGGIDVFLNEKMGRWAGSIWFVKRIGPSDEEKLAWSRSPSLRYSDGSYLEENAEEAAYYYRDIERRGEVYILGRKEHVRIRGVSPRVLEEDMDGMVIEQGRWLSEEDFQQGRRNCLVSWQVAENVSKYMRSEEGESFSLIGKVCLFQNVRLSIVGIFKPEDPDFNPWHLRKCVVLPVKAMQKYVTGFDADPGRIRIMVQEPRRITQEAKGGKVLVLQLLDLFLVRGIPFQPGQWRDHGKDQKELRMFPDVRLNKESAFVRRKSHA